MEEKEQQKPIIEVYRDAFRRATAAGDRITRGKFTPKNARGIALEYAHAWKEYCDPQFNEVRITADFGDPDELYAAEECKNFSFALDEITNHDNWTHLAADLSQHGQWLIDMDTKGDIAAGKKYQSLGKYIVKR